MIKELTPEQKAKSIRNKAYQKTNKKKIKLFKQEYYKANKEHIKQYQKTNKDKIKATIKANKDKLNKRTAEWSRNKYNTDIQYRLKRNISNLIRKSLKQTGIKKNTKTVNILGCTIKEFKQHLENQFLNWMTWQNRGLYNGTLNYGWDIDHIKRASSATNIKELLEVNHYTNFQPLCSKINRDIKK